MLEDVIDNIPGTTIAKSQVHGFGLFATTEIPKGKLLTTLDGQIVPWWLHEENLLTEEWNALPGRRVLVRPYKTKYYYINHSRTPNLTISRRQDESIDIITWCRIAIAEELFLDYRNEPLSEGYLNGHGATYL